MLSIEMTFAEAFGGAVEFTNVLLFSDISCAAIEQGWCQRLISGAIL
jgi:hypothetical protein